MKSPLTKSYNVKKIGEIHSNFIVSKYNELLNIDVSNYFKQNQILEIYKCLDSDYCFFSPSICGDSSFYQNLQEFNWYYSKWKWEYEEMFNSIEKNQKVIDIGCGEGYFLKRLKESKNCTVTGIEFNEEAIKKGQNMNVEIHNIKIEKHALNHKNEYDVATSFQVLEHVEDVHFFIKSKIDLVKKKGIIAICVPNNSSFIKYSKDNILNMPPHHIGLWNESSLKNLCRFFPLKLITLKYEPAKNNNQEWYNKVIENIFEKSFLNEIIKQIPINSFRSFLKRISIIIYKKYYWKGHSILAIYQKV